mgnify:CR=1 FL=1
MVAAKSYQRAEMLSTCLERATRAWFLVKFQPESTKIKIGNLREGTMYDWIYTWNDNHFCNAPALLINLAISSLGLMLRILRSLESLLEPANGLNL